jgi:SAM-dependent methyltransferase
VSTSSSTMPSLMARMLEALDVRDGHRVLEIGTGTGYNAALLCHRLGPRNVVSIDIDPTLVAAARSRLADLGYHPTLVAGDGTTGAVQHGPYDRNPEPGQQRRVIQVGTRRLWDSVEAAYQQWCHLGRPDPGRFGVVANSTTQFVWLDADEGWYRCPLPLA